MSQVTLISGVERRRVWSDEQKRALVAPACEPGSSVAEISQPADLRPSQLYRWRRDLAAPAMPAFAAVTMSPEPANTPEPPATVVELGGAVLRVAGDPSRALVSAICSRCGAMPRSSSWRPAR